MLLYLPLSSCKKSFLEVVPKGYIVATTYQDFNLLMNSSALYQYNIGGGWQAAALMGDDVGAEESWIANTSGTPAHNAQSIAMFRYEDQVFQPTDNEYGGGFTAYFLKNIFTCNYIINDVMNATGGTEQQKLAIQAEAKATRAFIYFQLMNYYAKPYDAASAATDPGFPIMTEADITMKDLMRNTVQEVYDFMLKDMNDALVNIPVNQPVATRMTRAAVKGLLGKMLVFMGRYSEALTQLNSSLSDIATMAVPARLYDYNITLGTGGSFLPVSSLTGPASPFNNETDLTESVVATMFQGGTNFNGYSNGYLVMDPSTMNLYQPSDWRLNFYTTEMLFGGPYPNGRMRKHGVSYVRFGLELPDLYLLQAECKARLNDLEGAKQAVELLRKNRIPLADSGVPEAIAGNQNALLQFIVDERIREFAGTGYRWFDMRRLSTDPLYATKPAAVHHLYLINGGTTDFVLRPERLTLRLPYDFIVQNPGMVNNP